MISLVSEDLYLNRAKFVMKYLGVWVPPENEPWFRKTHRLFMMSLQYLFLIFQIVYIIQVWGDLEAVSQASYLLFTQACLCFKVTVLQGNIDMLKELLKQMNGDIFKPQSNVHERILKVQATRIKRLLLAFMISSQATCGLWALKPLFDDAGSRKFPFDMWMPVNPEFSPQYQFGYAFQLLTICMSAYMYFGVDSVALSMVIFACAQIDIVKDKILSIKLLETQQIGRRERDQLLEVNYKKLTECIKHHQCIVSFTELVENAYHTYLFFQLSGSVGLICMSAFRILVIDWRSMQFFSILTYLSVMISQLFVCCWCGHELTATSEELHTVLYQCAWYEQDVRFKRALCIAMMRMSKPMVLRAGHYIALSRHTFVAILRMSYSYFAVLNQTNMTFDSISVFLSRPKYVLTHLGIWLPPTQYIFIHMVYKILIMLSQYAFILFEFMYIAMVWGDLEAVSEASYLLFTQASVCYKATVFVTNKNNLRILLQYMTCEAFDPQTTEQEKMLKALAGKVKLLSMFFLVNALTTCTLWAIVPLLEDERSFPFNIWMPFGPEKSPQYELGYVYQMMSIYISALLFFAVDGTTLAMIMYGCGQLEIIIDKLKKLKAVPMSTKLINPHKDKMVQENNTLFVECISQHQTIIRFIETLENSYHANIFFQLCGTVAIICIIGLRISIEEPSSVQFYSMLIYMVTMLSQLFLYCWCGSELTARSEDLRDSLYQCPWYEQDAKFKRTLLIAMECMKKPIIFKAGHYIPLSRPTFVSILKSSYSYFAFLNQANNK
ncbi:uncharacterized protein [Epargyreus clarus]|uniref:uncharacterized protein n=1 Tax=Epargyreus clarus TaxID=520877 RepID=UPI003C2BCC10